MAEAQGTVGCFAFNKGESDMKEAFIYGTVAMIHKYYRYGEPDWQRPVMVFIGTNILQIQYLIQHLEISETHGTRNM